MKKIFCILIYLACFQSFCQVYIVDGPEAVCSEATFYATFVNIFNGNEEPVIVDRWSYEFLNWDVIAGGNGHSFIRLRRKSILSHKLKSRISFKIDGKESHIKQFHINLINSITVNSVNGTNLRAESWNTFYIAPPENPEESPYFNKYGWKVIPTNASLQHSNRSTFFRILPNAGATFVKISIRPMIDECWGNWDITYYNVSSGSPEDDEDGCDCY